MSIFSLSKTRNFLLPALLIVIAGCSLEKESGFNRNMQNLTAHYNILFNANEILRIKQESYATAFVDSYNELLNVYPDTSAQSSIPDKDLELAISKANKIINIKEQSHYLGDAYLVMGKARFLEGSYFDAVEYFNYVIASYGKQANLKQEALIWKGRALLYLNIPTQAKVAIDTAIQNINPKKSVPAGIYATQLQYDINTEEYPAAEESAKIALQHCHDGSLKLRWTFILAQLQELNQKPDAAIANYTSIVKSNASFEMAFNANLNRIRLQDQENGIKQNKIERLRKLLKNQNNKEFTDQIYYQVAQQLYASGDIDGAVKNYKLSVRTSLKNQNQKGLSYLRIADIDFKNKADYAAAKLYYDSTLTYLAPTYPGYQIIRKKANNLQILTGLLQTISREDTLQMLAGLDEKARAAHIDAMVNRKILQDKANLAAAAVNNGQVENSRNANNLNSPQNNRGGSSTFYFYNQAALSQGGNDFKKQWGTRKLEDNWRRSKRSNGNIALNNNGAGIAQNDDPFAPSVQDAANSANGNAGSYRQDLIKNLPLTPDLLNRSNLRVYNAYMDMANFYRDVLGDKKEAIVTYELLLTRFPKSTDMAAIYYNLYRLYADIDAAKSEGYKNRILKEFPETAFAKIILDPEYAKHLDDANAEFTGYYNAVYELYAQKKYTEVITQANALLTKYPDNRFAVQLLYLRTIAAGHQEKLAPFVTDLQQIVAKYPDDKLVTPLAVQHLAYIDSNKVEMAARPVVLTGNDVNDIPFTPPVAYQKQTEYRPVYKASAQAPAPLIPEVRKVTPPAVVQAKPKPPVEKPKAVEPVKPPVVATVVPKADSVKTIAPLPKQPITTAPAPSVDSVRKLLDQFAAAKQALPQDQPASPPPVIAAPPVTYIFSLRDSTNYYFAINVTTGTTNLASSRFGIGQFNRTRPTGNTVRHSLLPIGTDDQLIVVGRFYTLDDVKKYAHGIIPLLPDIMKVPKDKYSFFIITRENLDKLADPKTLDSYIDYYQKYY
ncbi:tetratricopeptide repeat protein [Mucilaginibacter sp. FT3.2]|uniref:type IX secretion system periplasmic lipoprotein PorW/SprE n=1 Tax=Mucilaginibacter sp. FT3.2 TaxID=2723090 RepID=UPI00160AF81C|nr:tetratricopeptide repeat protein [Mucilaginibacter sp. FT3.2]MBB6232836.1 tetratricopeptide (TPR) repeat protein [Mucilaginibacter sp. FT3.2]